MIEKCRVKRAERFEAEERRKRCKIEKMNTFMEFSMKAIVTAVKKATKKD